MANKKKQVSNITEEVVKPVVEETEIVEEVETEEILEKIETNVEEETKIDEVEVEVVEEVVPSKGGKVCPVMLATPNYYIINKDGVNITIKEKNNKRRGDSVIY